MSVTFETISMQESSRTKNAKRNILWGFVNKIFSILLPFLTRTFLIQTIGAEYLGLDSLFTSVLQILNLSELGFGSAIVFSMYEPLANGRKDEICALLNFFRKVYLYIGLFILLIGFAIIPFLGSLIKGSIPSDINLVIIYFVFLSNTVLSYLLYGYKNSILNASQRVDVISNCASVTKGILAIGQGVVLYLTRNYYYFVFLLPLCTIMNNFLIYYYSNKLFPQYKCEGNISQDTVQKIKKRVMGLFATKFCAGMRNSVETISVSSFIGLSATAIYSNYYMTVAALTSICSVLASSILAGVGNCVVTESKDYNYSKMRMFDFTYLWICGVACTLFAVLLQPFMQWWVGEELMYSDYMALLFPLYFYSLRVGDIKGVYQDATGLWWENRYRAIIEIVMIVILNLILVRIVGAAGVVIATVFSMIVVNIGFGTHLLFKYYFKNNRLKEYYIDHIKYFLATLLSIIITLGIFKMLVLPFMIKLIVGVLISIVLPNILYLITLFRHPCLSESIAFVKNVLR